MRRERALKIVLVVVGLLFTALVYPLMMFVRQEPALAMMLSVYVTLGKSIGCLKCDSQDLTLQAILSNGVATVRQTLRRMFSAMAAERAKKRHKLVLTPVSDSYRANGVLVTPLKCGCHVPSHSVARYSFISPGDCNGFVYRDWDENAPQLTIPITHGQATRPHRR